MDCSICGWKSTESFLTIATKFGAFEVRYCPDCDVLQTVGNAGLVSPDYVDLNRSDIDDARRWCQGGHKAEAFLQWANVVKPVVARGGSIIDIGCGTGGFLKFAAGRGYRVRGFDASRAQVADAETNGCDALLATSIPEYLAACRSMPSCDHVTLWDVLEHVRSPLALLNDIKHLGASSVFVSVPNGAFVRKRQQVLSRLGSSLGAELVPWEHVFYYSPITLHRLAALAGLRVRAWGAVECYRRPVGPSEVIRRIGFKALHQVPFYAPQIFLLAEVDRA